MTGRERSIMQFYKFRHAFFSLAAVCILLVYTACVSNAEPKGSSSNKGGDPPAWFFNLEKAYPDKDFLAAAGDGDTRRAAESDAAGALVQIFSSDIKVESESIMRYHELAKDADTAHETEKQITQEVDILAAQKLLNIQYSDPYVDKNGRFHVVGYLDRRETGRIYRDNIEKNASRILAFQQNALTSTRIVTRYAFIDAALIFAKNNELLLDQLTIINPMMKKVVDLPYSLDELNTLYSKAAEKMVFDVQVVNDSEQKISNIVAGLLSSKGFSIKSDGQLRVAGEVKLEPVSLDNKYENIRWYLNLEMRDETGKAIVSFNQNQRETGISRSAVVSKAYIEMEKKTKADFFSEFVKYLDGLVLK